MPTTLTETDDFTPNVTIPVPLVDPISIATGGPLWQGLSALTNRSRWLHNILTSTGVRKIRTAANATALKGLAAPVPGDVAILLSGVPQLYLFRSVALAGSDITGARYDSTTATGQWVSAWYYLANVSGPSPRLDVQVLPPPNRLVDLLESFEATGTTNLTLSGGEFGPTLSIPGVEAGDKILLEASALFAPNGADGSGYVAIRVDGAEQALSKRFWSTAAGGPYWLHPSCTFTASTAGTLSVRLYQIAETLVSGVPTITGIKGIRAQVIRP